MFIDDEYNADEKANNKPFPVEPEVKVAEGYGAKTDDLKRGYLKPEAPASYGRWAPKRYDNDIVINPETGEPVLGFLFPITGM